MKYYALIDETGWISKDLICSVEEAEEKAKRLFTCNDAWTEKSYFDIMEINTINKEIKAIKRVRK